MQPDVAQMVMQARVTDRLREADESRRARRARRVRGERPAGGRGLGSRRHRTGHRSAPAAA